MQTTMLPQLSTYDPTIKGEGSIDPLGTYPFADVLALRIAPGVTERQRHPRFLTAMAVGMILCNEFPDDRIASDHISAPWQVYEWIMVESLVKSLGEEEQLRGLPGTDKTTQAIKQGMHLNANRYLKVPSVFGFHGVYRTLSRALKIEEGGQLGEIGALLVSTWEKEQGLDGFYGNNPSSPGGRYRKSLMDAIKRGLDSASAVVNSDCSEFFSKHLAHNKGGGKELGVIYQALLNPGVPLRGEYIAFLNSRKGRSMVGQEDEDWELKLLTELKKTCSADMAKLLETILVYERFIQVIEDRFYAFLRIADTGKFFYQPKEVVERDSAIKKAVQYLPEHFDKTAELLGQFNKSGDFINKFNRFKDKVTPEDWVTMLVQYHEDTQRLKPPIGKASWFERYDDGRLAVRPAYRHLTKAVHGYRANPLSSFLKDLRVTEDD